MKHIEYTCPCTEKSGRFSLVTRIHKSSNAHSDEFSLKFCLKFLSSFISSECSGETVPSVLGNDIMCWLIWLQKPVHSRFFEACADPEGGAGDKATFAKHTFISNKPFFEYVVGTSSHQERGWSEGVQLCQLF